MERVVLDTSVVASALRSRRGASNAVLEFVVAGRLVLLATPALFLEYEDVLKRLEQRQANGLSLRQVDLILAILARAIEPVEIRYSWRPQLSDPDDEMVLEAAVNGRADAIVTHNIRDFLIAGRRFGVSVVRPGALMRSISP